jgi:hypothetical protein
MELAHPLAQPSAMSFWKYGLLPEAVLGIRDILVRIRIPGSGPLMDPEPAPDQTPDPTPFFSDFTDATFFSYFLKIFFSYNLLTGTLSSILKI